MNVTDRIRMVLLMALAAALVAVPGCKKPPPPAAPLPPVAAAPKAPAPAQEAPKEEPGKEVFTYNPGEYRNPFGSLLRIKKEEEGPPLEELTPLQRVPVTELRLEGVILMKDKAVAQIIAPDGKAHTVTVGTPMGRHKGKVVRITSDAVVVEEWFEDYLGRKFSEETELKLRKGEEESL